MGVWRLRSTHMIVMIVVFMLRVTTYSSKNTTRSSFCSSARLEKPRKMKSVARVWLLFPMEMKGFLRMSGSKKNSTQFTESTTWPAAVTKRTCLSIPHKHPFLASVLAMLVVLVGQRRCCALAWDTQRLVGAVGSSWPCCGS